MVGKIIGILFFCAVIAVVVMAVSEKCRRGDIPVTETIGVPEAEQSAFRGDDDSRTVRDELEDARAEDYVMENMGIDTVPANSAFR